MVVTMAPQVKVSMDTIANCLGVSKVTVSKALNDAINFIETGEYPEDYNEEPVQNNEDGLDKWFDDLDKNL